MKASPAWLNRIERARALLILGLPVTALILRDSPGFFFCLKLALLLSVIGMVLDPDREDWKSRVDFLILAPLAWALVLGVRNANPGVWQEYPLFVLAPVTYLLLFRRMPERFAENLLMVCKLAALFHLTVFFFLYFSPGDSDIYRHLQSTTGFVFQPHDGFTKVYANQASQLAFLLPVLQMAHRRERSLASWLLLAGCLLMCLALMRKAIILLALMLTVAQLASELYRPTGFRILRTFLAPWILAIAVFSLISEVIPARYLATLTGSFPAGTVVLPIENKFPGAAVVLPIENKCVPDARIASPDLAGAALRANQAAVQFREILAAPVFGHGLGYVVPDCIRSEDQPWRYELVYLGLAMNLGILGLLILLMVYLAWIYRCMHLPPGGVGEDRPIAIFVVASLSYLACSASNPYVLSVEALWIYFLPYLLSRSRTTAPEASEERRDARAKDNAA